MGGCEGFGRSSGTGSSRFWAGGRDVDGEKEGSLGVGVGEAG